MPNFSVGFSECLSPFFLLLFVGQTRQNALGLEDE